MTRNCITLILTLLTTLLGLSACSLQDDEARRRQKLAEMRLARLQEESKLVFIEYTLKEICGSKDQTIWKHLGDKEVLYSLTAHVTAGIETSEIQSNALSIQGDSLVVLTLPHCKVFKPDIPNSEISLVYERVTGISFDLSADDRNKVLVRGEKQVYSTIGKLDIKRQAEVRAETFFRTLLAQAGFNPSRCKIIFK